MQAIETRYNGYRFRSRLEARWAVFFDTLGVEWEYESEGYDLADAGYYLPDFWLPGSQFWIEIKSKENKIDSQYELKLASLSSSHQKPVILINGSPGFDLELAIQTTQYMQSFEVSAIAGYVYDRWLTNNFVDHDFFPQYHDMDKSLQEWLSTSNENPLPKHEAELVGKLDVSTSEGTKELYRMYSLYKTRRGGKPLISRSGDECTLVYNNGLFVEARNYGQFDHSIMDACNAARSARFEHGENGQLTERQALEQIQRSTYEFMVAHRR